MNQRRLLVVDDKSDERATLTQCLEGEGFEVLQAGTPGEAVVVAGRERLDGAVIDLRLINEYDDKDFSGIALAKQLDSGLPKIIYTSFPTYEAVRRAMGPDLDGIPAAVGFVSKLDDEGLPALLTAVRIALSPTESPLTRKFMQSFGVKAPAALHHRMREVGPEETGARVRQSLEDVTAELIHWREAESLRASQWHRVGLVAGWVALALVTVTAVLLLMHSVDGGLLSLIATGISTLTHNVYSTKEREAHNRIRRSYNELERVNRAANMLIICQSLPARDRVVYLKKILDQMLNEKWLSSPPVE